MTIFKDARLSPLFDSPIYQQVYANLRSSILSGELKGGMKLPSTRALAEELNVSRNTILNAYRQLTAEGYIESVRGSGTYVTRISPEHLLTPEVKEASTDADTLEPLKPRFSDHARLQLAAPQMSRLAPSPIEVSPRPFRFGIPALKDFPYKIWTRLVIHQARRLPASTFTYQNAAGYLPLREAIAAHAKASRGVHCTPEQIIIISGAQGGLDLAARLLINSGDPVWMEDPGYLKARGAFLGSGAKIIPVPVDHEGVVVEAGINRAPEARLAYLTPSHQFPLGVTLSLARRIALLDWAKRAYAYLIEDDYDSEYHYTRRPLPALQGLDDAGRVIYIGTFSKVLFPALRLGYLILPPHLVDAFQIVRNLIDSHPPILEQAVLTDFIVGGHFARHLRRMRRLYAERRSALLKAARELPLEILSAEAGMHCVGWLPAGMDDRSLVQAAASHEVDLVPVANFSMEPLERKGILLGYSEYTVEQIQEGIRRLAAAMRSV
ncbi:MAG TPA: PLP-dependent aminotransferase family protein [Anaerolineales bacterium]|nr:PLP-dependent aminotransferase family protein [Anaerolineales bacterium]